MVDRASNLQNDDWDALLEWNLRPSDWRRREDWLVGRSVVVTGATGGIGSAVVTELVARGDRVLAVGGTKSALAALYDDSDAVVAVALDLARPIALPAEMLRLQRLHALIHCAGVAEVAPVERTIPAVWQEILTVNLSAPAELTRALLPALRAAAGHVVFVNSAQGVHAVPGWSAYAASKAGLRELADSLRLKEGRHGVSVASVYPGGTATELLKKTRRAFGLAYDPARCLQPETVASSIVNILDCRDQSRMTEVVVDRPAL